MKTHSLITTALVGLSCFLLAGCQPQAPQDTLPVESPTSAIPSSVPETLQVQADICGRLPTETVSTITGVRVEAPSVTTIESVTGAKRHVCTYSRVDDPAAKVVSLNVTFKGETKADAFQQLWANQQQAQQKVLQPVTGVGTEAFLGQVNNKPVIYMLVPDAQYWITMGETTQSTARQTEMIQAMAKAIAESK